MLTYDGVIDAFGKNQYREAGNGTLEEQKIPIELNHRSKFVDNETYSKFQCLCKMMVFIMFGVNVALLLNVDQKSIYIHKKEVTNYSKK